MYTPLDDAIKGVMDTTWPMIIICVLIISSLRIVDLVKNKKEFILYKEALMLLFLIYILCLFQIVTFEDTTLLGSESDYNLVPFKEIMRYHWGSRLFIKNVIGNFIMFLPFGFFISYFIKAKKIYLVFCLVLFASLCIEVTQYSIGRVFDVDDILLNVLGGVSGYFIYKILNKIGKMLPKILLSRLFLNILSIILVSAFVLYVMAVYL